MFCPQCGNQVPDGYKFCNVCGNSLTNSPIQVRTQPDLEETPRATNARRIIGLVLVIIGIVLGLATAFVGSGACATTLQSSALLGVPTCGQTTTEIIGLGFFAFATLVAGLVLVIRSRR